MAMSIARQHDKSIGSDGAKSISAMVATSVGVKIEGQKAVLEGDFWGIHKRGKHWHTEIAKATLPTNVFINGRKIIVTACVNSNGDMFGSSGSKFTSVL